MDSTRLSSFLLTVITGTVFPGHILGVFPVTEKSYEQAVLKPFVDGLNSLTSVAETLLTSNGLPQVIQNVRQLLESSRQSLSKAEQSSLALVKSLSTNVEERLDKINRLNNQQQRLQQKDEKFKLELYVQRKDDALKLQAARKGLKDATDAIDRARKAWQDAQAERKKGGNAIEAIKKALQEAKEAISMRTIHSKTVEACERFYRRCEDIIRATEQHIADNTVKIEAHQQAIISERALHKNLNSFLISLRKCTSLLSTFAGKTSAANMYLELSGVLDGLLGVLNEIIVTLRPLVESSKEYSLLISARLPTIIQKLEEANRRLKKTPAS